MQVLLELPRLYSENNLKNKQHNIIVMLLILSNAHVSRAEGAKKVSFTACLWLASCTCSPVEKVILTSPKMLGGGGMNRNDYSPFLI